MKIYPAILKNVLIDEDYGFSWLIHYVFYIVLYMSI